MSTELYYLWELSCDSRSTSLVAIVFSENPRDVCFCFDLWRHQTKMAAGSLKGGSVRRKCSRKLARKAGFIRRLHGRSRKVGSSYYIVCAYRCVCVCMCVCEFACVCVCLCVCVCFLAFIFRRQRLLRKKTFMENLMNIGFKRESNPSIFLYFYIRKCVFS